MIFSRLIFHVPSNTYLMNTIGYFLHSFLFFLSVHAKKKENIWRQPMLTTTSIGFDYPQVKLL